MPRVCVLYPDTPPPYDKVFQEIVDGIAASLGPRAPCSLALSNPTDPRRLEEWLRTQAASAVITLGRYPTHAYESSGARLPQIIGALDISPQTRPGASGLSIAADPALLLERLHALAPDVKRVLAVYDPARDAWLVARAQAAAAALGLDLRLDTASNLLDAAPKYGAFVRSARPGADALWLLSSTLSGDPSLLAYLIERAWLRRVILFSDTLEHAQAGALFAAYPDARALGKRLGEMALRLAEHPGKPLGIAPLREIKFALNVRVARHLGLIHGEDALDRFDRVLDVTDGQRQLEFPVTTIKIAALYAAGWGCGI